MPTRSRKKIGIPYLRSKEQNPQARILQPRPLPIDFFQWQMHIPLQRGHLTGVTRQTPRANGSASMTMGPRFCCPRAVCRYLSLGVVFSATQRVWRCIFDDRASRLSPAPSQGARRKPQAQAEVKYADSMASHVPMPGGGGLAVVVAGQGTGGKLARRLPIDPGPTWHVACPTTPTAGETTSGPVPVWHGPCRSTRYLRFCSTCALPSASRPMARSLTRGTSARPARGGGGTSSGGHCPTPAT
jgi:hypothetical protein